ncbi:MAG: SDR family oxidoreductase [Bacteroidales bacterium]
MKILLTGVTGYIGGRLLPALLDEKHSVVCVVRDIRRFPERYKDREGIEIVEGDFLDKESLINIPLDIDIAYYLIHSMSSSTEHFSEDEALSAMNFVEFIERSSTKQVIYLSGIGNDKDLSKHLSSREKVASILRDGKNFNTTILRAAIIIGSGSASFEIIRDLVEKLPIMTVPKFMKNECQPIAIRDVIYYLINSIANQEMMNRTFDIGGPSIMSYLDMLKGVAKVRKLKRHIFVLPLIKTRLCANWLYFVTSTSYTLALNLTDSMKNRVVCSESEIKRILPLELISFEKAVELAYDKIEQDNVLSSWRDSFSSSSLNWQIDERVNVPSFGTYSYKVENQFENSPEIVIDNVWQVGGTKGWWYANWLWRIRGYLDLITRGVGLSRGRTNKEELYPGQSLDFWRVLIADKEHGRLLLYAEMKMPGEGWLEFRVNKKDGVNSLKIEATMRPKNIWGRAYWYATKPLHYWIFNGMFRNLTTKMSQDE